MGGVYAKFVSNLICSDPDSSIFNLSQILNKSGPVPDDRIISEGRYLFRDFLRSVFDCSFLRPSPKVVVVVMCKARGLRLEK